MKKTFYHLALAAALFTTGVMALAPPSLAMIIGSDRIRTKNATILESDLDSLVGAGAPAAAGRVFTRTGISAAGTTQGTATALTGSYNNVTTCATDAGVKLPAASVGQVVTIRNSGVGTLRVWPFLADGINALAVNLSVSIPPLGEKTFRAINTVTWYSNEGIALNSPGTQFGSLAIKAADSAGNTQTLITNASQAGARTYTIPDGGASANFLLTTGTATATTATTGELSNAATDAIASVTQTEVSASGSTAVQFTFKNAAGAAISSKRNMQMWISDSAGEPATAVTSVVTLTNGSVDLLITGKIFTVNTSAAGLLGVTLTVAGATTKYLSFRLPNGKIITSTVLTINA